MSATKFSSRVEGGFPNVRGVRFTHTFQLINNEIQTFEIDLCGFNNWTAAVLCENAGAGGNIEFEATNLKGSLGSNIATVACADGVMNESGAQVMSHRRYLRVRTDGFTHTNTGQITIAINANS